MTEQDEELVTLVVGEHAVEPVAVEPEPEA